MAIAKELDTVYPRFIQPCPLCGRNNRIVVHGLWVLGDKAERHPDMGYSFCNCRSIFYTRPENVTEPENCEPVNGTITLPDPFFAWPDPYQFLHWDVRRYEILWPMDVLVEHLKEHGYDVLDARRNFDLNSKIPQHYHIRVS